MVAVRAADTERVVRTLPNNWQVIKLRSGTPERAALSALRAQREVEAVLLNYRVEALQVHPNDEFFNIQGKNGNRPAYPAAYADEIDGAMAVGAVNRSLKRASDTDLTSDTQPRRPSSRPRPFQVRASGHV